MTGMHQIVQQSSGEPVASARSYLYAPGHDEKLLRRVFEAGADAVILDLEDSVPADMKPRAREMVREALNGKAAWVRVNAPITQLCEDDLARVAQLAVGIRVPKVESAQQALWTVTHSERKPVICLIESALGLMQAQSIAQVPGVVGLALGTEDLALDTGLALTEGALAPVRVYLSLVSRAAGLMAPSDGAFTNINDLDGLRRQAESARNCGFGGKSAIHPHQVAVINEVFTPSANEIEWAERVLSVFEASAGSAAKSELGEMVDRPIAERARRILELARGHGRAGMHLDDQSVAKSL